MGSRLVSGAFALCLIASCATPTRGVRAAEPVQTSGVNHTVGAFAADDEQQLFWQAWQPATGQARSVLVVVHGLKDHSGRYDGFARRLVGQGIAVHAFDLRGHGRSSGQRVWVDNFDDYVADLEVFLARVRKAHPDAQLFLFGHSMGGLVASSFVASRESTLAGLILSGPALELDIWPMTVAVSRFAGRVFGNLPALKLPNEDFSRSKETLAAMGKDPLVYQGAGPARTAGELAAGIETVWARVDRFTMPLLLLHGSKDKLTDPHGSKDLHRLAPARDKTLRIYEGYWHDLMHEPDAERVIGDVVEWLKTHDSSPQT